MLLVSVEAKTFRDRTRLALLCGGGLATMSVLALWAFSSFGATAANILDDLPEAVSALVGASGGGNYAISEIFSLIAPAVVLVVAISAGANAVAGEERDHTAGLLLAQPVTRRRLVLGKSGVLVSHVLLTTGIFLAGFLLASGLFDTGVSTANAAGAGVHLAALGWAFGMIALAIATATGSAVAGVGTTAGLAVATNLVGSLLPLTDGLAGIANISPWHYYDSAQPLANGLEPRHILVLGATGALALAGAVFAIERRDIGSGDQRGFIAMIPALDRFTRPRVTGVFAKALSERTILVSAAGGYVGALAIGICLLYSSIAETMTSISRDLPTAFSALVGTSDLGSPVGWLNAELYSLTFPIVLVCVAIVLGVGAIAGEQKRRTLDLLLAAPVSRRHVVLAKAAALVLVLVAIAAVWTAAVVVGSAWAGLGLGVAGVVGATAHLAVLAVFFGAVALALGSWTTHPVALGISAMVAGASYLLQSFLPLNDRLAPWAALSPWHYYSSSQPLTHGANLGHLLVLAALAALALVAAALLVERREVTA